MGSSAEAARSVFITEPHGVHEVTVLEDAVKPDDRIYEICDRYENRAAIRILGSELASLCQWWSAEKERSGVNQSEEGDA
jgi:hypothetical protein